MSTVNQYTQNFSFRASVGLNGKLGICLASICLKTVGRTLKGRSFTLVFHNAGVMVIIVIHIAHSETCGIFLL